MVYSYDPIKDELQISPTQTETNCTLLVHTILRDDEESAKHIIKNDPQMIHQRDSEGRTALHIAVRNSRVWGLKKYVQLLLDNGADPNVKTDDDSTPLMIAACYSNTDSSNDTVKILLKYGANPNEKMRSAGITALRIAVRRVFKSSSVETIKILLEHGTDPNIQDHRGRTALHDLLMYDVNEVGNIIELLIDHKADPTIKDFDSESADLFVKFYYSVKRNKELEHQISVLNASPTMGKDFIDGFMKEYMKKDDDPKTVVKQFIDGYIPILIKNLEDIVSQKLNEMKLDNDKLKN